MARVLVAAPGWLNPGWDEHYYPADIPQDWKLAFYANDFTAVVVDEAFWREDLAENLAEMLEDIDVSFSVFLRISTDLPKFDEVKAVRDKLENFFAGFLVDEQVDVNQAEMHGPGDYYFKSGLNDGSLVWERINLVTTRLNAVVIDTVMDNRELKNKFEAMRELINKDTDFLVLLNYPDLSAQQLKDMRILLELMAIA